MIIMSISLYSQSSGCTANITETYNEMPSGKLRVGRSERMSGHWEPLEKYFAYIKGICDASQLFRKRQGKKQNLNGCVCPFLWCK